MISCCIADICLGKRKRDSCKKRKHGQGKTRKSKRGKPKDYSTDSGSNRTASSGGSDSESDTSLSDDTATGNSLDDSSSSGGKRKKRWSKKQKAHLAAVESYWAKHERPVSLQEDKVMVKTSLSKVVLLKDMWLKEQERRGIGTAMYGQDHKPKPKKFEAFKDNGETRLHPARFLALPFVEPGEYWRKVPTAKEEVFRHLPLQYFGLDEVPEATVAKLHNRKMPVTLDMMAKEVRSMKQVQLAVQTYVRVHRYLHPIDMSGQTIQLVLTEAGWGDGISNDDRQKVAIIKKFFDSCVNENAKCAGRKKEPLSYDMVKARWIKAVTAAYPQLNMAMLGQQVAAMGGGSHGSGRTSTALGSGASRTDSSIQHQGAGGSQLSASGGAAPATSGPARTRFGKPARFQGLAVCFGYNSTHGCRRLVGGTAAASCSDGKTHFAHRCNYFIQSKNDHCLADHSKIGNH